jgi:hypothetical protein
MTKREIDEYLGKYDKEGLQRLYVALNSFAVQPPLRRGTLLPPGCKKARMKRQILKRLGLRGRRW